ncbi:beta-1,4-N-acetylgalactosaminyltransferase bre-4-like [Gigantopelta aegis]|uniref:beta-1,4-N-acetylgalactosaminyltransferase bre-4-like n=1 Tax=Gigantopelta aegis TaxID=1735272 RepID=UPI001B88C1EA|nr:beta-1,4-N-acetylgalactosaminyltransferase bre-4-like [Gigantopelta aegis]
MFENCTKLKVVRTLLIICLSLVVLQGFVNIVSYKYMSRFLSGSLSLFSSSSPKNYSLSVLDRLSDFMLGSTPRPQATNDTLYPSSSYTSTTPNMTATVSTNSSLPLCPLVPPSLVGPLATYTDAPSFEKIAELHRELLPGGRYKPAECVARHRIAIIIPYRNREEQLRILLHNIHPILKRQQLDYGIYVIEQALPTRFNRAMLMNIGFKETLKIYDYQCFFFHDVDLIPENDLNLYTCPDNPRHMSAAIDKFKYNLPYTGIFGGVSALSKEHMEKVNGFSNKYFGWGGEDDDMSQRIVQNGLKIIRYPLTIARYKMIKHGREKTNEVNKSRFALLNSAKKRMKVDGLNSLKYTVNAIEFRPLYTLINVLIDEKYIMKSR